ncbi:DUF4124 domain-containing protein [Aidingimonas halophila]|uniref:DUF4124 domain-containing protein n=1 Tax=Aidingimonas halophila TaxID=574349 RepID=A0A1H3FNI0_9GAMM|nr:DUF4124 domain-containing protein [Aidingimonas halophila]GHC38223.1 hypothetical protein GCM10008094_34490 [Aidingimonas halophila]SDX92602.1 protein of unknown function [Aidingimonas halophila]
MPLGREPYRRLVMVGMITLHGLSAHAESAIYRVIDEQGRVLFTDRPQSGSERVDIPQPSAVLPVSRVAIGGLENDEHVEPPPTSYSAFSIVAPEHEATLPTGQAGDVVVEFAVAPALHESHRIQLRLDGEVRHSPAHARSLSLSGLVRGEHTLEAELLDADGKVLQRSKPVTLYVQRAGINLPANPNNPDRSLK